VVVLILAVAPLAFLAAATVLAANPQLPLLSDPVDVSGDFHDFSNFYYLADRLAEFDPATHAGNISYQWARYHVRHAFDNVDCMASSFSSSSSSFRF
jgi:alpha-D-xyloside xylohydrolase